MAAQQFIIVHRTPPRQLLQMGNATKANTAQVAHHSVCLAKKAARLALTVLVQHHVHRVALGHIAHKLQIGSANRVQQGNIAKNQDKHIATHAPQGHTAKVVHRVAHRVKQGNIVQKAHRVVRHVDLDIKQTVHLHHARHAMLGHIAATQQIQIVRRVRPAHIKTKRDSRVVIIAVRAKILVSVVLGQHRVQTAMLGHSAKTQQMQIVRRVRPAHIKTKQENQAVGVAKMEQQK